MFLYALNFVGLGKRVLCEEKEEEVICNIPPFSTSVSVVPFQGAGGIRLELPHPFRPILLLLYPLSHAVILSLVICA